MKRKPVKPVRPEGFPLYPHASGYWAKEIRGKTYYLDTWDRPKEALEKYLKEKDYLQAGIRPPTADAITLLETMDRFLEARKPDIAKGELSQRTWNDYQKTCKLVASKFGHLAIEHMMPEDFGKIRALLAKGVGTATLGRRIREARVAMRYLSEITGNQPRFGKSFQEPSARSKRAARAAGGAKLYTAEQVKAFLESATNPQFKAMILLGINCAFGNKDCATLRWDDLDLETGWHDHERPKTHVKRRAKLWTETIAALRKVDTHRGGLVFKTKYGNPWIQEPTKDNTTRVDAISQESRKIGLEFYSLRRTFRTIAEGAGETLASRLVMGHTPSDTNMDHVYVQAIADSKLEKVAEHVHDWLFG